MVINLSGDYGHASQKENKQDGVIEPWRKRFQNAAQDRGGKCQFLHHKGYESKGKTYGAKISH